MPFETWPRWLLAVLSGLLLSLAFPKVDLGVLAWVAFVPLLYALSNARMTQVFFYGWLQGFSFFILSLYWIGITLHNFTSMPLWFTPVPLAALAAIEALYGAVAVWAAVYVSRSLSLATFVTLPVAWAGLEWARATFPIGFPWNLLGDAAYRNLVLIQYAELTGVYGVSALIMLFNAVLFEVLHREGSPRRKVWALSTVTVAMVAAAAFGLVRIQQLDRQKPAGVLKLAMAQGNIAQEVKWDPNFRASSFQAYTQATVFAARNQADLVIWPEAAATFIFQPEANYPDNFAADAQYREMLLALARQTRLPILFGAVALRQDGDGLAPVNRAYLVSADGRVQSYYDKIQLVPFGEYVPLRWLLGGFVNAVAAGFGDMVPGGQQTLFDVKGARLGILICYESLFPDLTRRAVDGGADMLVNITNDAWYGTSAAPYQLLSMAAMRAVENHTPVVRVANTGISAVIDPLGRIRANTELFKRTTRLVTVKYRPRRTLYAIVGDLFAQLCFGLTVLGVLTALLRPTRTNPSEVGVSPRLVSFNGCR
jgi:apolipoprotein N-acyltransferase